MITIINYGVGNIGSVANALTRLGQKYQISADSRIIAAAEALLLPGVGAAGVGMQNIKKLGLETVIRSAIQNSKPFLGVCLGMQLLFDYSEEANTQCLGIFKGTVKKFRKERKVPQIGWNQIQNERLNIKGQKYNAKINNLFRNIPNGSNFYFVNSYYPIPKDESIIAATTEYGEQFASIIATKNVVATQFHPEKSGEVGLILLQNFIKEYL